MFWNLFNHISGTDWNSKHKIYIFVKNIYALIISFTWWRLCDCRRFLFFLIVFRSIIRLQFLLWPKYDDSKRTINKRCKHFSWRYQEAEHIYLFLPLLPRSLFPRPEKSTYLCELLCMICYLVLFTQWMIATCQENLTTCFESASPSLSCDQNCSYYYFLFLFFW